MNPRNIILRLLLAITLGLALSVIPFEIAILLVVVMGIVALVRARHIHWPQTCALSCIAVLTMLICAALPVKQLDAKVGPLKYTNIPLQDICSRLHDDHGIVCSVLAETPRRELVSFATHKRMSRRDVLVELAEQTGLELRISNCGTGATILFGAYPCFTSLLPRDEERR